MRKLQILCCYVLLSVLCCSPVSGQIQQGGKKGIVKIKVTNELVETIGLAPKTHKGIVKTGIEALDHINQQIKAVNMGRVFPYAPKFEEKAKKHGLHQWYEIRYENPVTPENAKSLYEKVPGVIVAEVIKSPGIQLPKVVKSDKPATILTRGSNPFNDPLLSSQWHYNNDGKTQGAVIGSDINLYEAWKITTGTPNIIVAILDGGIDYKHKDIAANMWINEAELNGKPGVDDDGNGYVDDVYGYNFVDNTGTITPGDHGTHVAGTVAAVNNNGIGVCGVAGGSGNGDGIRLMSCQIFDGDADYAKAFYYAAVNGAVIAQCSWGWPEPEIKQQSILDAIDYFVQEAGNYPGSPMKGGICIFAAGNQSGEGPSYYPAAYPVNIAVGAMGNNFKITSYSNNGEWVDVIAPGGVLETISETGVYSTLPNDSYGYMQGTSQACPHVAGIAALILSKYGNTDYTPEMLRSRLLTAVHDIYKYNPEKTGQAGEGYIDAALALKEDQGKAPHQVTDLELYPDQMSITAEWIIPEDEDDGHVQKHILYYSEQEFTATTDLKTLKSIEFDTKFLTPGEKIIHEFTGFKPETNYWLSMQAIDRWGNASLLSEIQQKKTNKGPELQLDKSQLALTLDVTKNEKAEDPFILSNTGEGLLKWSGIIRTVKPHTPSATSVLKTSSPRLASVKRAPVKMSVSPYAAIETIPAEYTAEDYPKAMSYYFIEDETYPAKLLGETDTTKSNSLAQWFVVDETGYPDGFNLTGMTMIGQKTTGRTIIEVYSGEGKITPEYLLCSDTIGTSNNIFGEVLNFSTQLYFAPGETFWVVAHIEKGNNNPLGAGYVQDANYNLYSYYSSDMGKNWMLLKEAVQGGKLEEYAEMLGWGVAAISNNPNWGRLITLEPASGNIRPAETQQAMVSTTGKGLINGTYKLQLALTTNDPNKEHSEIPLNVTISGQKPALQSAKVVDFGKIFINETKDLSIEIFNAGYGSFAGKYGAPTYQSSHSDIFAISYISKGFAARSTSKIQVRFKPVSAGIHSSTITLTDQYGTVHKIQVTGTAIDPAKIVLNPTTINAGDLEFGTPKQVTFNISNTGQYPLEYVMPKFSDEEVTGLTATSHRYGYSYETSIYDDPNYSDDAFDYLMDNLPLPELINPTDIKGEFGPLQRWSKGIDLGFAFPFYGEKHDSIYISSLGALSVTGAEGTFHAAFPPEASDAKRLGLITALGSVQLEFDEESHLYYGKQNGKFVISYENAIALNDQYYMSTTGEKYSRVFFRILLSNNGDIEYIYQNLPAFNQQYSMNQMNRPDAFYLGIADIDVKDPLTLYNYRMSSTSDLPFLINMSYIKISAPQPNMISKIEAPNGTINIGETETITLTLEADTNMYKGASKNILTLLSNDPKKSTSYVTINANITGNYYKPEVSVNKTDIQFGEVFQGAQRFEIVTISNKGKAEAIIQNITLDNNSFSLPADLPAKIDAGCSYDLVVNCKTGQLGEINDILHIAIADQTFEVNLKASIINAPNITITPASRTMTMNSGDSQTVPYTIKNTGANTLTYAIKPQKNFYPVETPQADDELTYVHYNTVDKPDAVDFDWIDITQTGEHLDYAYLQEYDFKAVDLPFPFPFYGKNFTKAYICISGFITFTEYEDLNNLPGPVENIPSTEHRYKNFIAPYWGNHSPSETKEGGIYYQAEGDRFIVSFVDYANSDNLGVCFQAILYKDGKIKYQYTLLGQYAEYKDSYGVAGIENEDGTSGILLPDRSISMENATMLYPMRTHKLVANATANVNMMIDTKGLLAGNYALNALVNTNVPQKKEMQLGLNLTLAGTPVPVVDPVSIDLGDIILESLESSENFDKVFNKSIFTVSNSGTAAFKITNITYNEYFPDYPQMSNFLIQYSKGIVENTEVWDYYIPKADGGDDGDDGGFTPPVGGGGDDGDDDDDDGFGKLSLLDDDDFGQGGAQSDGTFNITKGSQRFALLINNTYDITEVKDTLVFHTDAGIKFKVPFRYNLVESPVATSAQKDYRLYTPKEEFIHDSTFTLGNSGQYPLSYQVSVEYDNLLQTKTTARTNSILPAAIPTPIPAEALNTPDQPQTRADEDKTGDKMYPVGDEYRRHLAYPWGNLIGTMGTGEKYNPFVASVKFQAPADGFNISAIQYVGSLGPLEEAVIRAEIRNGSENYLESQVVAEAEIKITGPEQEDETHLIKTLRTIEFKNPVYLNPNETFFVYLYFPAGAPSVLTIAETTEAGVTDRYWAKLAEGWNDISSLEAKYGPIGFTVRCLEKVVGEPWISLKGNTEGTLSAGNSEQLTVHVNALQARNTKNNKARVLISSNDPKNPELSFYVTLDKNSAPVITVADEKYSVKEEENAEINFHVKDLEGDTFTVSVEDDANIAALKNDTTIILTPKFGHTGNHTLKINAKDSYDNESSKEVEFYVEKVNQQPIVVQPIENMKVKLGDIIESIDLSSVFSDPDGDELTYQVSSDNESVVIGALKGNNLEIIVKGTGEAEITLTAVDPSALAASISFKVSVGEIQNKTTQKQIEAYPNPVVYLLSINCPKELKGEATIRIYGTDGSLYYTEKTVMEEGVVKTVDMTNYPSGVYILEIENRYEKLSTKVIKM